MLINNDTSDKAIHVSTINSVLCKHTVARNKLGSCSATRLQQNVSLREYED